MVKFYVDSLHLQLRIARLRDRIKSTQARINAVSNLVVFLYPPLISI